MAEEVPGGPHMAGGRRGDVAGAGGAAVASGAFTYVGDGSAAAGEPERAAGQFVGGRAVGSEDREVHRPVGCERESLRRVERAYLHAIYRRDAGDPCATGDAGL